MRIHLEHRRPRRNLRSGGSAGTFGCPRRETARADERTAAALAPLVAKV
jgi:hypothetical protein